MTVQKRTNALDWNDLRYLLELSRQGSLSGAARTLGVNHATVGRRLAALEAHFGASLTERQGRLWRLTALGQQAVTAAARIEEPALQIERLAGRGGDSGLQGDLRLTATEGAAMLLLVPALGELRRRHPGLRFTLLTDHKKLSLARREADLALRWGRPRGGELYARKLGDVPFRLYARAGLALAEPLPMLGYDASLDALPEQRWLAAQPERFHLVFRCNSMPVLLSAARDGLGAILLPDFAARHWPDLTALDKSVALSRELWLVRHKDMRQAPRLRAAADAIAETVTRLLRG
ncbi:LysR family transcriptional regulator [Ferrovibrio sp.]|uniref:LysR family transcriptional regulator n=1 Tax=Ferrovibrio sp. TaxID=1917215 RepID=UPI001B52CDD5|nr:LysR family transcriptional regulator [Ferrovibrio sp.]MBP7064214.1 LysR family transcriptional regulator [Ferrovibrio sp.]